MQFFLYDICAVLLKHHGVNNRHYYFIKDCLVVNSLLIFNEVIWPIVNVVILC